VVSAMTRPHGSTRSATTTEAVLNGSGARQLGAVRQRHLCE
jgi:hypothetical protein